MDFKEWSGLHESTRASTRALLESTLPAGHRPEAWTPYEVFHHVLLVNAANVALLERLLAKHADLKPRSASSEWDFRYELLDFPLDTAFSVPAFRGTEPSSKVTSKELAALEADTDASLKALAQRAQHLAVDALTFPHPLAGKLNFGEWLVFGIVHERLHRRQLALDLRLENA